MLQVLFNKYTEFAKSFISARPAEEVPADLSDSHLFVTDCDMNNLLGDDPLRDAATTVENGYESCIGMVEVCTNCKML